MPATNRTIRPILVALFALAPAIPAVAAGNPDPTFSGDGRAAVSFPHAAATARAVAALPDGSILVGGTTTSGDDDFVVAKLRSSGALDAAFGDGGRVTVPFDVGGSNDDRLIEIVALRDKKVLLLGAARAGSFDRLAMARLTYFGELDDSFGSQGKSLVTPTQWPQAEIVVTSATVQADGKFLFAGSCRHCPFGFDSSANPFVARLLSNGALDPSFGSGGWIVGPWHVTMPGLDPEQEDYATDLAVDSVGRILAQVYSIDISASLHIARFQPNGSLDSTWGDQGIAKLAMDPVYQARAMAVNPSNDGVYTAFSVLEASRIRRLLPNGQIDPAFAYYGNLTLPSDVNVADLLVDPSGRVVAVGDKLGERFWLARILANGTPDSSFSYDGYSEVEFDLTGNGDDVGYAAALSGAKLVTVGSAESAYAGEDFAILRTD